MKKKSFVTTGALEAHLRIQNKTALTLSEQNLIDCSKSYGIFYVIHIFLFQF
jgi:hypothetical protein